MKKVFATCAALVLLLGAGHAAADPVRIDSLATRGDTNGCDNSCLAGVLDQFLAALARRDATAAPLAAKARYTENGIELPFGDGLWRTYSAHGDYRHVFADHDAGQVAMFATIKENGVDQLLMLRLKVDGRKVSEAEALIQRRQVSRFINTDGLKRQPIWDEKLAPGDRSTRAQLIAAVDPYFDGLITGNGDIVPFADDCWRWENGIVTAGIEGRHPAVGATPTGGAQRKLQRCRDQFNAGGTVYVQTISPRRFLVVDEERGLVFGVFHFVHPGDITEARGQDGTTRPMPESALRPFTVPVAELFKVRNGKIVAIEAIMTALPYGSAPGW